MEAGNGKDLKLFEWTLSLANDFQVTFILTLTKNWELIINEHLFADLWEAYLKENPKETGVTDSKTERKPRMSFISA